jgi:O-antigen ligase/tetratricopeptide (TPR) repeat protein
LRLANELDFDNPRMSNANAQTSEWVVITLGLTFFLAPSLGVPSEELIQDTLKSMVVSLGALIAAWVFFWHRRASSESLRWHRVLCLPLLLMAYALGSMAWSHTYLAGVEAVRWFIFSLILWLGLNTFKRENFVLIANAIHWGAVMASLWVMLQFLTDFDLFPQGPNPASTFVNRNFFAEFGVCTVPFSAWILANSRGADQIMSRGFFVAFNVVAILMTGTRSALVALGVLLLVLPLILFRYRAQFVFSAWPRKHWGLAGVMLVGWVLILGLVPTGNKGLIKEDRGRTALERSWLRAASISDADEFTKGSGSVRMVLWKSTARMIAARPLMGVGAGAWEADVALYQVPGQQIETDFYAHNEFLHLLAEYGVAGWIFLLMLLVYLGCAAWTTWRAGQSGQYADSPSATELPIRAITLASVLALLLVSGAGFPWRLATTGALFAVLLAILAASDARLAVARQAVAPSRLISNLVCSPRRAKLALFACTLSLILAVYIAEQAAVAESKIVRATKLALTISNSGDPNNPRWAPVKEKMLTLVREGIAINPHYRKITPLVADELARWGDWKNAIWIWQSVLASRPHVVAILTNVARGYANLGDLPAAFDYLNRARAVSPQAPGVVSLEALLWRQSGQVAKSEALIRQALKDGIYDIDLLTAAQALGRTRRDWPLVIQALELRAKRWPRQSSDAWLQIGDIYLNEFKDEARALAAYQRAVAAVPLIYREMIRQKVPPGLRAKL